ncbi:MAG TPA: Ig-like domain-containing protein [Candidatus Saccharimonadales bacterium]|nr:Ig-like domain-containing protein [Candidatus Saccharimonadales bacterium]
MSILTPIRRVRTVQKISVAAAVVLVLLGGTLMHVSAAVTPVFKQSKAVEVSKGTTGSVTFTSANTAGDLIVVQVLWSNTGAVTLTDSRGNAYVAATARSTWSGDNSAQTFYAKNVVAGTNTVTAKFATILPSYAIVQAHEYSGIDKVNPVDGTSSGTGTSATAASGNVTTTGSSDVLFAGGGALGSLGTAPTGWTARLNTSGNRTADRVTTAAGAYSFSTSATGNQWVMQLVAFKADGGSSTDTTSPTAPGALQATAASSSQITLGWTAATDNVGVTGYQLERCQAAGCATFASLATLSGSATAYSDTGLSAGTSYSYRLRAVDAAGNLGAYSSVVTAATPAVIDTAAPSVPANLAVQAISATQANLSWSASTDNVGVTGYKIYRDGAYVAVANTASFQDQSLTAGTPYSYAVSATDAAGNESAQTVPVAVTTPTPDTTAPVVSITAPVSGGTVSGTVTIIANATDSESGVHDVQFFANGASLGNDTTAPYSFQWNTTAVANGTYQLTAVAKDTAGNTSAASSSVTVQVNNVASGGGVPKPLKIMPLGDSLTQGGVNANLPGQMEASTINGYRLDLWNLLSDYPIDYVGSEQIGNASLPDHDENGFSGACIMVSPCGGGTLYPQTAAWITSENPDLILLNGGENDFSDHTLTEQQDATNMESWIQLCWSTSPNVKIIVTGAPWHDTYDSLVHTYVSNLQAQGKAIRWVPYGSNITRIDGTHPDAAGYTIWANELAPMVRELFPQ